MTKAPGSYLHGEEGPVVVLPARFAAILASRVPLSNWRIQARDMQDVETYNILNALHVAANSWNTRDQREPRAKITTIEPAREHVSASAAAGILGLSARGIRDACEQGRLKAVKVDGRWQVDRLALKTYRSL